MKIDPKKSLKHLYAPSAKEVSFVDVPAFRFLIAEGDGGPDGEAFMQAVEALYAVSYTLKFLVKKAPTAVDYAVMPLEAQWWADDMESFTTGDRTAWKWQAMILQPEYVTEELVEKAFAEVERKKHPVALKTLRFETFTEGPSAQILHLGPFADEAPNIQRVHAAILAQGSTMRGKHHEIYLSDPRRTAPEKLKTIIRQSFA